MPFPPAPWLWELLAAVMVVVVAVVVERLPPLRP